MAYIEKRNLLPPQLTDIFLSSGLHLTTYRGLRLSIKVIYRSILSATRNQKEIKVCFTPLQPETLCYNQERCAFSKRFIPVPVNGLINFMHTINIQ